MIGMVAESGDVYIGGDSACTQGHYIRRVANECKLFRNGPFLIGCAGSFRYMQVLRYRLRPPAQPPEQDTYDYMCTGFVDALRDALRQAGQINVKEDVEAVEGECLIGYRGRLFSIGADFAVTESAEPEHLEAVGIGGPWALGAAMALESQPPGERLRRALEVSGQFCGAVRSPYKVEMLPGGDA